MRHRLYYLLPDLGSARRTLDDMLLNRIEVKYIHFLTGGASLPPDMPEANIFHKTDVIHGAQAGMIIGAILGIALGALMIFYYGTPQATVLVTALIGILFGGWASSMAAAALPNSRLKAFYPELEQGKLLMIADVPARRVKQIEQLLAERHPEMRFCGEDPNVPAFP